MNPNPLLDSLLGVIIRERVQNLLHSGAQVSPCPGTPRTVFRHRLGDVVERLKRRLMTSVRSLCTRWSCAA